MVFLVLVHIRLEVVVVFAVGHLDERVLKVSLAGLLLREPDFVKTLSADTTAQVSMKLDEDRFVS